MSREVVVGSHSNVWKMLSRCPAVSALSPYAIGHADLATFTLESRDRVWILSYSRRPAENAALLDLVAKAGVREIVYVSSSSAIVDRVTSCYDYPRVKRLAELDALGHANGKVLTVGMMYHDLAELPCGTVAATSYAELDAFIATPVWPTQGAQRASLVRIIERPFRSNLERWAYRTYGALMHWADRHPCILRPLDLLLRLVGVRWYGYVYLSNRLWNSTI